MHIKSQEATPAHYPVHQLLEGKMELYGRIKASRQEFSFLYDRILENATGTTVARGLKGKLISVLIDFDSGRDSAVEFVGMGKPYEIAYELKNSNLASTPVQLQAKMHYDLASSKKSSKRTKI